jgi:alginate O-acetyltransferase complex protein AlgI
MMAMGLGKMLGFDIPVNFRQPYMARSVSEFWRRWHITLSRWFREYVYIPLGGNRKGKARTFFNLFVVWTLTALWHGASPNFLIWGAALLVLLAAEKLFLLEFFGTAASVNSMDFVKYLGDYWKLFLMGIFFATPVPTVFYKVFKNKLMGNIGVAIILVLSMYYLAISANNPFLYFNF